ncbi:hypothetical protein D3C73_1459910 [compost metagenome]
MVARSHQRIGQGQQRCRIQAVSENLCAADIAFLHIKVNIHTAPDKPLIQQMTESRCLTEIPFPATLFGKPLRESGNVRVNIR